MERFDTHCHIFNITSVGWKAIIGYLTDASEEADRLKTKRAAVGVKSVGSKIKRLAELIRIFTSDSEEIFSMLDKHYNQQYKLCPLMFDGDFLLDSSKNKDEEIEISTVIKSLRTLINSQNNVVRTKSSKSSANDFSDDDAKIVLNFLDDIEAEKRLVRTKKSKDDGFTIQYNEIKKLASNTKYNKRFIPFLGVDPRRKNIKSFLAEVGKGKLFAGVKVYPPNGFSPMDKELVGKDSVFEFCSKNNIPVISHCSYGGFATPAKSISINGYIMPKGKTQVERFDGVLNFEKGILDGFTNMVIERAQVLNHPKIWREVLKVYPNLKLILAHFGSGSEEWKLEILSLMKDYANVYTDVSCMSDIEVIEGVKEAYTNNPEIRHKILYGSDYFLDMFFNDSFDAYLNRIKDILGNEIFDKISIENPKRFLE